MAWDTGSEIMYEKENSASYKHYDHFAVLVTFLAASVVTYNKLNTYMQRGVREEAQYICLAMDEYGDSFLTKKLQTVSQVV